jgi:hypothetical protein
MLTRAKEFELELKICGIAIYSVFDQLQNCDYGRTATRHVEIAQGNPAKWILCAIGFVFPRVAAKACGFRMRKNAL